MKTVGVSRVRHVHKNQVKVEKMQTFNLKNPSDWSQMLPGEVIAFEAPNSRRCVAMSVHSTGRVSVYVGSDETMQAAVLAASADGQFLVQYSAAGESFVQFKAEEGTEIFVSAMARPQVVRAALTESYASIEPRNRRNSEFDRMMQLMRYNEARRDKHYRDQIAEMQAAAAVTAAIADSTVVEDEVETPKASDPASSAV